MTDPTFEQQVAEALLAVRIPSSAGMLHLDVRDVVALAPRVAAAILAAITKVNGCHCCADQMGWDEPQKAALAALRGARRAPAETPE